MDISKNLLILGAGQYSFVVAEIARSLGYEKISFLDDNSPRAIGKINDIGAYVGEYSNVAIAIGNPDIREMLADKAIQLGFDFPPLVHPTAFVSSSASIGKGVIIEPNVTVQANAVIGNGSILSSGTVIRHNGTVGCYCHCDCACVVMSTSIVSNKMKIKCGEIF